MAEFFYVIKAGDRGTCVILADDNPRGPARIVKWLRQRKPETKHVVDRIGQTCVETFGSGKTYVTKVSENDVEVFTHIMNGWDWTRALSRHHDKLLELRLLNKPQVAQQVELLV